VKQKQNKSCGSVALIGAGPGAVDLLTVRAVRLIEKAEVIFYDALVNPEILQLAPQAKLISVGKRCGKFSTVQKFINKQLIDAAQEYQRIVRLKGGDPMLFGRAQEEIIALQDAGISFEIVPGITSALGAASLLQASLTQRGVSRSVCFVTPRIGEGEFEHDWIKPILNCDTSVIYMGMQNADRIGEALLQAGLGKNLPVVLAGQVSNHDEWIVSGRLYELARGKMHPHEGAGLIMVGNVFESIISKNQAKLASDEETMKRYA